MNIVITGASYGLGRAMAIELSRRGNRVIILARNEKKLQETKQFLKNPELHKAISFDLNERNQIISAVNQIREIVPKVDVLINNAAGWSLGSLTNMNDDEISTQISSTITGNILFTKHLMPLLKKTESPHIVNISSVASLPNPNLDPSSSSVAYCASKWGFTGFSESLRKELAKENVKVTTIYPGKIATDSSLDDTSEQIREKFGEGIMGVGVVAKAVSFCLDFPSDGYIQSLVIRE